MLSVTNRPIQRVIIQGKRTAVVQTKPRASIIRVVQTVSPVPVGGGEVSDPGDLTLLFDNRLF